jgi:hypothetical protein
LSAMLNELVYLTTILVLFAPTTDNSVMPTVERLVPANVKIDTIELTPVE